MLFVTLLHAMALARPEGIVAADCNGCHSGGQTPDVDVSFAPGNPQLGGTVTITIAIEAVNGGVGGISLQSNGPGHFVVTDSATRLIGEDTLVHKAPKAASGGTVTFHVQWVAPATAPGGVEFDIATLSANDNDDDSGDTGRSLRRSFAYGCPGTTYFRDYDGDGAGSLVSGTTVACVVPNGFSETDGDCDDNDERRYPGATELCNGRDDDCDGVEDDGLESVQVYPDGDDDGYGGPGTPMNGCAGSGYGVGDDDCDDDDSTVYPGAKELCDYKDNDCDGDEDERVKPQCGVGRCTRESFGCEASMCYPGEPLDETCNLLDDDCDGVIDGEGSCPDGKACDRGVCVTAPDGPGTPMVRRNEACASGATPSLLMLAVGIVAVRWRRSGRQAR